MSSGGAQGLCTKACEPVPTANDRARGHKQRCGGSASGACFVAASRVRLLRKKDPYKGKGIRYVGEVIRLKSTKK